MLLLYYTSLNFAVPGESAKGSFNCSGEVLKLFKPQANHETER